MEYALNIQVRIQVDHNYVRFISNIGFIGDMKVINLINQQDFFIPRKIEKTKTKN